MDTHSCNSLNLAVYNKHESCVRALLAAGADPDINIATHYVMTPLHFASSIGHDACVRTLLGGGANPNVAGFSGWTPLHDAVNKGHVACVRTLLGFGANPNVVDDFGFSPLYWASWKGHKECAKIVAVRVLEDRSLTDDEWDLVPLGSDIGHLLPVVMIRDGRDAAAKLVSKLPEQKRYVLETATMCLSRVVLRDVAEQILVRCV